MENASKALLMAAGVLIGLLVLSLAVYLFVTFGATSREIRHQIDSAQLTKFNANFTIYADRDDITIYDIISLANLAEENNVYYRNYSDYKEHYKVTIVLVSTKLNKTYQLHNTSQSTKQKLLQEYNVIDSETSELQYTFSNSEIAYNSIGRVAKVQFREND